MKRLLLLSLALCALCSCHNRQETRTLTLMTYNVGVFSKHEENATAGVAQLIRGKEASLVALNELDSCNTRHNTYQVKDLAEELGPDWGYLFARAIPYKGGAYGNGVVSAKPILSRYCVPLPKGEGSEARSVAVAETEDCVFAATHLDHRNPAAALEQMCLINNWFAKVYGNSSKPVFLCGDFNVTPDSEVIALAKTHWTLLSGTDDTFPTPTPRKCIDYIFALKSAAPVEVIWHSVLTEGTESLSDHFPILLTVKF